MYKDRFSRCDGDESQVIYCLQRQIPLYIHRMSALATILVVVADYSSGATLERIVRFLEA